VTDRPILEIDAVGVVRDGRSLLDAVSVQVGRGTTHVLLGPNGAGKTTLLGAVLGQVPFSGGIRFHWRGSGRLGYVPQTFHVDRTLPLTVGEFLALGRQRRPVCFGVKRALRAHLRALLDHVGLADCWMRQLGVLSGGELRRVLLANAIDPLPELLLLDEPASGLDEIATRQFESTIAKLTREAGSSVLMVSHDLGQVRRLADCVTLIDQTVRRSGPPAEVIAGDLAALFALGTRPFVS
jgi:zinc transport system ATP-binding protein